MAFKKKSSGIAVFFVILFIIALLSAGGYFLKKYNISQAEKVIDDCEKSGKESFCSENFYMKFCVCRDKVEKESSSSGDGISNVLKLEEDLV